MIYKLQRKFIVICGLSLFAVLLVIYALILGFSAIQLNAVMDQFTERISSKDDQYLDKLSDKKMEGSYFHGFNSHFYGNKRLNADYFIVSADNMGNILSVDTDKIYDITDEDAAGYVKKALDKESDTGWVSSFRYRADATSYGKTFIFVDASMNISSTIATVLVVYIVLFVSFLVIFILIMLLSHRAVQPIAESYDKQKQFITDANHELKTPLTLILANLDIVESEIGKNEWLDDIRSESERMSELVNQLVILTRMDESKENMQFEQFNISDTLLDSYESFYALAEQNKKTMTANIQKDILFCGDQSAIRRLFSILLDNAVKYCDEGGDIVVRLTKEKNIVVCIENSFSDVKNAETDKFFDRHYRSDKSRTYDGSFGIGLSIARAIVQNRNGKISVYQKDSTHIGFKVVLKQKV